jgi:microcystin-dependent protein
MKVKVYAIDVQIPRWLRRAVVFGAVPAAVLLGAVHYLRADVAVPNTFADNDTLSATRMNANFATLQSGMNALAATVTTLQGSLSNAVPPGTVVAYAGTVPPKGWVRCNGDSYDPRHPDYAALFAAIGTVYGGDGVSSFVVPDLQAATVRGVGTSKKFAANATVTQGQVIDDQLQGHRHDLEVSWNSAYSGGDVRIDNINSGGTNTSISGRVLGPISDGANGLPRTGAETTCKAMGLHYIIKY